MKEMKKEILENLPHYLEYGNISQDAKKSDIIKACETAKEYGFVSCNFNTNYLPLAVEYLRGTGIKVGCGCDYPFGGHDTLIKAYEAKRAAELGADELDVVMNVGRFLDGDYEYVLNDLTEIVNAFKTVNPKGEVKIIIETANIGFDNIAKAVELVVASGADYVKSSTGFAAHGAKLEHIKEMTRAANGRVKVKAAGGIRGLEFVYDLIEAGAVRFGGSAYIAVVEEAKEVLKNM